MIVTSIIGTIGAVACGIGVVVTAPIQACILTVAYRDVFDQAGQPADIENTPPEEANSQDEAVSTE